MAQDWTSFTKSITVRSSKEKLYHAFATRAGMESWFLRSCNYKKADGSLPGAESFATAGDKYTWLWFGYGDDTVENGEILQANGQDLFEFTFNSNGKNDMKVKVEFEQEGGEWRVNLHQYNIPDDDESRSWYFVGCGEGWTFYLANLKSILEGGIDLRNKNEAIHNVVNS
jgi:uncharacterized protein YndB with AHSA1/START domain